MPRIKLLRLFLSSLITVILLNSTVQYLFAKPAKDRLPVPDALLSRMASKKIDRYAPIYMRAFKKENIIEILKQAKNGHYVLIKSYRICRWSGKLGPKIKQGDHQTPEGFYSVTRNHLNPNSSFHLSFNIGFPNAYDRVNRRTGSYLMVHGNCQSIGCFAMTNRGIEEIYALTREAFAGGQKSIPFHSFPFRMTQRKLASNIKSEHANFWLTLKPAYDIFETTRQPPRINLCGKSYAVVGAQQHKPYPKNCRQLVN